MNGGTVCMLLNILLLIVFCIELWKDYDIILDKSEPMPRRRRYIVRLIASSIAIMITLYYLYYLFGIDSKNLAEYVKYGEV